MTGGINKVTTDISVQQYQPNLKKNQDAMANTTTSDPSNAPTSLYPQGAFIPGTPLPKKPESKIIVIDDTAKKDIDGDKVKDNISHGEQVAAYLPQDSYEIVNWGKGFQTCAAKVKAVRERAEKGENIGALNMSLGTEGVTIDKLRKLTGIKDLDSSNIKERSSEIIEKLREKKDPKCKAVVEVYDEIDKLSQLGVPVVIAAGNDGPNDVNLLGLNPNAIVTGARDFNTNQLTDYTANNSTVDISIKEIQAKNVDEKFDFNQDGTGDIPVNAYSKVRKYMKQTPNGRMTYYQLSGTSYSAPQISKVAKLMHDQGIPVAKMNEIFAQANQQIEADPSKDWETVVKGLASQ